MVYGRDEEGADIDCSRECLVERSCNQLSYVYMYIEHVGSFTVTGRKNGLRKMRRGPFVV